MSVIVVLGMHRSGTSAVGGMLHEGGIFMGDQLVGPSRNNQKGHFEDKALLGLNREILKHFGGDWKRVPIITSSSCSKKILNKMCILYNKYKLDYSIWGWKDPRMVLTFDVWQEIFDDDIFIICIRREANSVAKSLQKRDRISLDEGLKLRDVYNSKIKAIEKKNLCIGFSYESLLEDPKRCQKMIENFIRVDLKEGWKFIERSLDHSKS